MQPVWILVMCLLEGEELRSGLLRIEHETRLLWIVYVTWLADQARRSEWVAEWHKDGARPGLGQPRAAHGNCGIKVNGSTHNDMLPVTLRGSDEMADILQMTILKVILLKIKKKVCVLINICIIILFLRVSWQSVISGLMVQLGAIRHQAMSWVSD